MNDGTAMGYLEERVQVLTGELEDLQWERDKIILECSEKRRELVAVEKQLDNMRSEPF